MVKNNYGQDDPQILLTRRMLFPILSLEPPTSPMRREAASAGFYESPWGKHPRIQLLTIEDLLGEKSIDYPQATDVTFKKAQRVRPNPSEKQKILPLEGESPEK